MIEKELVPILLVTILLSPITGMAVPGAVRKKIENSSSCCKKKQTGNPRNKSQRQPKAREERKRTENSHSVFRTQKTELKNRLSLANKTK